MKVIEVQGLSKKYILGESLRHDTLRETMAYSFRAFIKNIYSPNRSDQIEKHQEIWALKDISFSINQGEIVGIIGRNGAGKSTLLKIISRITEPTEGYCKIYGRVGSIIEVGTGFHPDLTGRENIYLNGAILGMRKREIHKNFDEIVAFAGIEKFIDTPVKHFSSGMYLRLAFAVAAHLETEILLVDEALAVGDMEFQKKCIRKIISISDAGQTILFVSHNMGLIRSLCERAIWLDNGFMVNTGNVEDVVKEYEAMFLKQHDKTSFINERNSDDIKDIKFYFKRVEILNQNNQHTNLFRYNEHFVFFANLAGELEYNEFSAEFYIYNELAQLVSVGASGPYHGKYFSKKTRRIKIDIGPLTFTSGTYRIALSLVAGTERIDTWEDACVFVIVECQPFETTWEIPTHREGVCVLRHSFSEVN